MSRTSIGLASAVVLLAAVTSCRPLRTQGTSPLKPAGMSQDSVALDILFIRTPFGDGETNGKLWEEIDEQHFPSEVRRELAKNGFRVGVVGTQMPVGLSKLMPLADEQRDDDKSGPVSPGRTEGDSLVTGWHSQCRPGRRLEIAASGVYDELPVLMCEESGLCGQSYAQAQGMFAVKQFPEVDGRVRLDFVPELHFGQARQRPVPAECGFKLEVRRSRRVFDKLAFSATLMPGQMVVLGCLPNRPGSLGHHFLTQVSSGQREQKLLVIRLSQTQHDGLFAPVKVLPLDDLEE
jgi:hypothetical protein